MEKQITKQELQIADIELRKEGLEFMFDIILCLAGVVSFLLFLGKYFAWGSIFAVVTIGTLAIKNAICLGYKEKIEALQKQVLK